MARKSDGHDSLPLDDLTPRNDDRIRGGDGEEERKKSRKQYDTIIITKPIDASSPYLA